MTTTAVSNAPSPDTGTDRVNLMGLTPEGMAAFFAELGEKPFRVKQVLQWIHQRGVRDFAAMTDLSKALRQKLEQVAEVRPPELVSQQDSADGTRKWLVRTDGGDCVEAVYIPERERGTLCVSSQIGCALDCSFCATGKQGFSRNLTTAEILGQLWIAVDSFGGFASSQARPVTNVVMMGMGEPLMNFDNVVDAMNLMMHDCAYGLSKRRVTLSTAGVVPALDRLADVTDVSLAISLHAPNNPLRDELVPINRKYPVETLVRSARNYLDRLPDTHRKVTVEYTLMDHVNDRPEHARELSVLLRELPCKINLIPFNPFPNSGYDRVSNNALNRFRDILSQDGYTVTVRTTRGDDIAAACGQLAGSFNDKTRRKARYQSRYQQQAEQMVPIVELRE